MATVLVMGRQSSDGAAGLVGQGFGARVEQFKEMLDTQDAELRGYWYTELGEIVVVFDMPDDYPIGASVLATTASGAWSDVSMRRLYGPEEMDAGLASIPAYAPPGGD